MIITVDELKTLIHTEDPDEVLGARLRALESAVRNYTNNNFQVRAIRSRSAVMDGALLNPSPYLRAGDTVQISDSPVNNGLYVFQDEGVLTPEPWDCAENLVTKIEYPPDIKMGVVNLMKWENDNRDKVGVASETVSRHSVTYFNMDGTNSLMGYPSALMGFLRPYMKARF